MFLAINEMRESKLKYALITGLLFLIAYLMFFLSGLANGLVQENRSAIDHWQADTVLLSKDANATLSLSQININAKNKIHAEQVASLQQFNTIVWTKKNPKEKDKQKVSLFGIENDSFLLPKVIKGHTFTRNREVVIDKSLADKKGFDLGDKITFLNREEAFTIVGYTDKSTYNVSPVIYMTQESFQLLAAAPKTTDKLVNAFIVKGKLESYPKNDFQKLRIKTFIQKLPGYQAQVLTFGFMIGFLILISAIIIGIFMYVLTIQKVPIFGIMKAQGIANSVIATALLSQTLILSLIGSGLGWFLTWVTAQLLPNAVPYQANVSLEIFIFISMIICALLGTLFSVITTVKIDPLKAIG